MRTGLVIRFEWRGGQPLVARSGLSTPDGWSARCRCGTLRRRFGDRTRPRPRSMIGRIAAGLYGGPMRRSCRRLLFACSLWPSGRRLEHQTLVRGRPATGRLERRRRVRILVRAGPMARPIGGRRLLRALVRPRRAIGEFERRRFLRGLQRRADLRTRDSVDPDRLDAPPGGLDSLEPVPWSRRVDARAPVFRDSIAAGRDGRGPIANDALRAVRHRGQGFPIRSLVRRRVAGA